MTAVLDPDTPPPGYTGRHRPPKTCPDPEGHRARDREAADRAGAAPETSWWLPAKGRCPVCWGRLP